MCQRSGADAVTPVRGFADFLGQDKSFASRVPDFDALRPKKPLPSRSTGSNSPAIVRTPSAPFEDLKLDASSEVDIDVPAIRKGPPKGKKKKVLTTQPPSTPKEDVEMEDLVPEPAKKGKKVDREEVKTPGKSESLGSRRGLTDPKAVSVHRKPTQQLEGVVIATTPTRMKVSPTPEMGETAVVRRKSGRERKPSRARIEGLAEEKLLDFGDYTVKEDQAVSASLVPQVAGKVWTFPLSSY